MKMCVLLISIKFINNNVLNETDPSVMQYLPLFLDVAAYSYFLDVAT